MTGHPRLCLFSSSIAMVVNVLLNLLLIVLYGINRAAIATAIENVLNFIFMYRNLKMYLYDKSYLRLLGVLVFCIIFIYVFSRFIYVCYFLR